MKEKIQEILLELIRDYKSRKWLTILFFCAIIILNKQQNWGMTQFDIYLISFAISIYVIIEGLADLIERYKSEK